MKNVKNMSKRGLTVLLALVMCLSALNLPAFAADIATAGFGGLVLPGIVMPGAGSGGSDENGNGTTGNEGPSTTPGFGPGFGLETPAVGGDANNEGSVTDPVENNEDGTTGSTETEIPAEGEDKTPAEGEDKTPAEGEDKTDPSEDNKPNLPGGPVINVGELIPDDDNKDDEDGHKPQTTPGTSGNAGTHVFDSSILPTDNADKTTKVVTISSVKIVDDIAGNGCLVAQVGKVTSASKVMMMLIPAAANIETISVNDSNTTYQWYMDGNPIPGATGKTLSVFDNGKPVVVAPHQYTVKVTVAVDDADPAIMESTRYQAKYYSQVENGGFENPRISGGYNKVTTTKDDLSFVWRTRSNTFEVLNITSYKNARVNSNWWQAHHFGMNPSIPEGSQVAEINAHDTLYGVYDKDFDANAEYVLYQAIVTYPGQILHWGISHRGRAGEDTMAIFIGGNDPETVDDISGDRIAVITTGNDAWRFYSGDYKVPEGQYITYFSLGSVSTGAENLTSDKGWAMTFGNLIDFVQCSEYGVQTPAGSMSADFWIRKTVTGNPGKNDQFTFELALVEGNANAVYLVDKDGKSQPYETKSVQITGAGSKSLLGNETSFFRFTKAGTYKFELREVNAPGYVCDNLYEIEVEVGENAGGKPGYGTSITYYKNGSKITASDIYNGNCFDFTNEWTGYAFTKETEQKIVKAGETVDYTVTVKNLSGSDKTIAFSDDLANGQLTLVPGSVKFNGVPQSYTSLSFDLPLKADETVIITYSATVNEGVEAGTKLVNTAIAKVDDKEIKDTATVTVEPKDTAYTVIHKYFTSTNGGEYEYTGETEPVRIEGKVGQTIRTSGIEQRAIFEGNAYTHESTTDDITLVENEDDNAIILEYRRSVTSDDEPGEEPDDEPGDPVIPPVDPVIPPVDPVIPPVDPVIPPVTPVNPVDPTEPNDVIDIPEENVPLTDEPENDPEEEEIIDIPEEDVPLAAVPQTGDYSHIWGFFALISGAALALLVITNKKREENV